MTKFQLGDRVKYKNGLRRRYKALPTLWQSERVWEPVNFVHNHPEDHGEGVVVGIRTLSNGVVTYDAEEGNTYRQKETFQALVIAHSMRSKPVYVRLEDVELITKEEQ